jgi:glycosyltransferase involved in cell wall biosynthesis
MRILVITDLYPPISFGGYEMDCAALVEALRTRHDVVVLTSNLGRDGASPVSGVLRELPYLRDSRAEVLRAPVAAASAAGTARRVLKHLTPELVYVSNAIRVPQAALCVALQAKVPMVYRLSELWFASSLYRGDRYLRYLYHQERGLRGHWGSLLRTVNRHPGLRVDPSRPSKAAISWCSEYLRSTVRLPPSMTPVLERTIYPGSRQGEAFARLTRRPHGRPTIAYVGRLTVPKGIEVAIRALAALRSRHGLDARLVVAGPGTNDSVRRLTTLANELAVGHRVELRGTLDTDGLTALLERCHAMVIPSVAPEAFPNVCLEGALARMPIVASRAGGIVEALHDAEHALLFTPGHVEECADALFATLTDPAAARARVQRAFVHAQRFTLDRYVTESEALIMRAADLLAPSPAGTLTP